MQNKAIYRHIVKATDSFCKEVKKIMEKNETTAKGGFLAAISIAALFFSSYVGPGFAAGTQTVSYFLTKGSMGVIFAPALVGVLTFFWCYLTFEFNRIYKPKDYREQSDMIYKNPVARHALGIFKDVFAIIQVLLVVSGMISGAATILESTFNLPMIVGTLGFAIAMIGLTLYGSKLVLKVGNVLTILIIAIVILIFAIGIGKCWPGTKEFIDAGSKPEDYGFSTGYAWVVMLSVITLYTCGANAAVPACRLSLKTKTDTLVASLGSAILCAGATIACTVIFAGGMPEISKEPIPMLYAMQSMINAGGWSQAAYIIIALSAMLSTGVGLLSGVSERFQDLLGRTLMQNSTAVARRTVIGIAITILSVALSKFGILAIISKGYTMFTLVSAPVLIYLLFITVPYRMHKDKEEGIFPEENA